MRYRTKANSLNFGPISRMYRCNIGPVPIPHPDSHDMGLFSGCLKPNVPFSVAYLWASLILPFPILHLRTPTTTFCSFTYFLGHRPYLRSFPFLINSRIDHASENPPLNFCRRKSCCIFEPQRHRTIHQASCGNRHHSTCMNQRSNGTPTIPSTKLFSRL